MAYENQASNPRRVLGFGVVVLMHVGLVYALANGLAQSVVEIIKGPMETKLIEEIKPEDEKPPPPPPKFMAPPPPQIIMPELQIEAPPAEVATNAITTGPKQAPKAEAAPAATVPPRSNPRRPVTQPEYPPTSKRLGEAGTVVMLLTVNEEGKVTDAKIDQSSGFERLDEAAVKEALRAWKLLPGTVGGKPVTMQYRFRVTFKITDN